MFHLQISETKQALLILLLQFLFLAQEKRESIRFRLLNMMKLEQNHLLYTLT